MSNTSAKSQDIARALWYKKFVGKETISRGSSDQHKTGAIPHPISQQGMRVGDFSLISENPTATRKEKVVRVLTRGIVVPIAGSLGGLCTGYQYSHPLEGTAAGLGVGIILTVFDTLEVRERRKNTAEKQNDNFDTTKKLRQLH